ncbi:MAG: hypothetical protein K2M96_05915 [Prevotella sp.]|nr:hypothetical protein [Prevotella sp.]
MKEKSDSKWLQNYNAIMQYMEANRRRPSKHRIEDHRMLNWLKYNKKLIAAGKMSDERLRLFHQLMDIANGYRKLNQYAYGVPMPKEERPSNAEQLSLFDFDQA